MVFCYGSSGKVTQPVLSSGLLAALLWCRGCDYSLHRCKVWSSQKWVTCEGHLPGKWQSPVWVLAGWPQGAMPFSPVGQVSLHGWLKRPMRKQTEATWNTRDSCQKSQALATPVSLPRSGLGWKAAVSAVSEAWGRFSQGGRWTS